MLWITRPKAKGWFAQTYRRMIWTPPPDWNAVGVTENAYLASKERLRVTDLFGNRAQVRIVRGDDMTAPELKAAWGSIASAGFDSWLG